MCDGIEMCGSDGMLMRFRKKHRPQPWAVRAGSTCTLPLDAAMTALLAWQRFYAQHKDSALPPEIELLVLSFIDDSWVLQTGARFNMVWHHQPKRWSWTFEKWFDGPKLPKAPHDWLVLQMPKWMLTRASKELGTLFWRHITEVKRTVLLLDPNPVSERGTDMDRYAEGTRERRSHRTTCWMMRKVASEPLSIVDAAQKLGLAKCGLRMVRL